MDALDELHSLVQDLRLYITQEYPDIQMGERSAPISRPKPIAASPMPVAANPPVARQEPIKPPPVKPKAKEAGIPTTPLEPIMQALCRPFSKPAAISLEDCIERLKKLGLHTLDAPQEVAAAAQSELVVVSFFAPGSDEEKFIQKVAASVSERITPCSIYLQPGLSAAAECFTLAASKAAKAMLLAYRQEDAAKLKAWLAYFGDDIKETALQKMQLASTRILFTAPLYDLVITPAILQDAALKRALWNDLQAILCQ